MIRLFLVLHTGHCLGLDVTVRCLCEGFPFGADSKTYSFAAVPSILLDTAEGKDCTWKESNAIIEYSFHNHKSLKVGLPLVVDEMLFGECFIDTYILTDGRNLTAHDNWIRQNQIDWLDMQPLAQEFLISSFLF